MNPHKKLDITGFEPEKEGATYYSNTAQHNPEQDAHLDALLNSPLENNDPGCSFPVINYSNLPEVMELPDGIDLVDSVVKQPKYRSNVHVESTPVSKSEQETPFEPANTVKPKNYRKFGISAYFGTLFHNLFGSCLGVEISRQNYQLTPEQLAAIHAKHADELERYKYSGVWGEIGDNTLVDELQERFMSTANEAAKDFAGKFIPDGFIGQMPATELPISIGSDHVSKIKEYSENPEIIDQIDDICQRRGLTYDDAILNAAAGNFHFLTRLGFNSDAIDYFRRLGSYNNYKAKDNEEFNIHGPPTILANPTCRADALSISVKKDNEHLVPLINRMHEAMKGSYFGRANILNPDYLQGPKGKILGDVFSEILNGNIAVGITELKTNTSGSSRILNPTEIPDTQKRDIGHTIHSFSTLTSNILGMRNSRLFYPLKLINEGNIKGAMQAVKKRGLPTEEKTILEKYIGVLNKPNKVVLSRMRWPIVNEITGYIDIRKKMPEFENIEIESKVFMPWVIGAHEDIARKVINRSNKYKKISK